MEKLKGIFGFGCMRLPMKGEDVDTEQFKQMVDAYMDAGFNYFDTARVYIDGKSETAIRDCIVSRYPRESFVLTDKLSGSQFSSQSDIEPLLKSQLSSCGVEYFDIYLMHSQSAGSYAKFKSCRAYETALELRDKGLFRHFGISFHDTPELLREILTEYPQIEVVQIQFNYMDYDDPVVQSRRCYEVCREFNKPVLVMEPVKGGNLAALPKKAGEAIEALGGGSPAAYALRFAAGFEGMLAILSGMSTIEQVRENVAVMRELRPLDDRERSALKAVCDTVRETHLVACTRCRYCVAGCPKSIPIPDVFSCLNSRQVYSDWSTIFYYEVYTENKGKASSCIKCGKCESICPQHLPIRELLKTAADTFETEDE
jgi:hypothetical protein